MRRDRERIRRILALLEKAYGRPPAWRRTYPIDELIRTILSQNTSDTNSLKAFAVLKRNYPSWDRLERADVREVARLIRHAGLANIKAKRIKDVLTEIRRREGALTLKRFKSVDAGESLDYLKSFSGVGPKTAACVLLFSFNKPVMPVDTHIFRVTKRLGLIDEALDIEEAHEALTALVPAGLIYGFHLGIIEHGRRTCKAQNPHCGECILYRFCRFKDRDIYRRKCKDGHKKS